MLAAHVLGQGNPVRSYVAALLLVAVALGVRWSIAPLEGGIQYVTFFPAVALAAVFGGLWPGLLTAMLATLLASYYFWPPYGALVFQFHHSMMLSNAVFMVDAVLVSGSVEAMHRFYRRYVNAEQQLRLAASVFENSMEGVMVTNVDGVIEAVNPAFTEITGYSAAEALGRKPSLLRSDHQHASFYRAMWDALLTEGRWEGELWNRRKGGEAYLASMTISSIPGDHARCVRYVSVFHDVTAMRETDAHVRHLAFHDALTGLPNRALFEDRLRHALARARREQGRLALAFLDLDGFKKANDTWGHDVGDLLLREVGERIKSRVRTMDTVARLGGDEFVILMEDAGAADCAALAKEIIGAIAEPAELRGASVVVGASVGIAQYPEDGTDEAELMKAADRAMYQAKAAGRNAFRMARGLATLAEAARGLPHSAAASRLRA